MTAMRLKRYPSPSGGFALGKMGVGATMLGGWKNPYVTDGAFFLFDGEWNAGGGLHTNEKTWTDLIGGGVVSLPSAVTVASNHIEIRSAAAIRLLDTAPQSDFSVEYVFSPYDNNTSRESLFESVTNNQGWRYKKINYILDSWISNGVNKNIANVVAGEVMSIASTFRYDGAKLYCKDYLNGVEVNDFSFFPASVPTALNGFQIGRVGAEAYTTYQDVYRVAVYSRAILASEIAANYEIDKERFNLQ